MSEHGKQDSDGWCESADSVLYEFSDVVVPLPPGTPAPPRLGRLTKAEIDELQKLGCGDSILHEFTDSAEMDSDDDDEPETRA